VGTVEAFLAGCPAAPATAARRVAAIGWHHRHSLTGPPVAGIPDRRALRASLGRPPPTPTRPPPDPEALAAAVRALPTTGWTGGFFGRRDAAMLTLAASPLPWTALAGLRTGDLSVAEGVLHLPGGHRLPAEPDPASCPPRVWLRWARALGLARREGSIRVLRAALDRAAALSSASPHRCRTPPGLDWGGDAGGEAVFTPIDQHGYPTLDRALAPTSLARLAARHLDGRPPPRRIMAPTPRPAGRARRADAGRPGVGPGSSPTLGVRPTGPTSRSPRWIRESWWRGVRRRARTARGHGRVGDRLLRLGRARPAARPRSCADPVAARAGAARGPAGRHPRPRRLRRGPPGPPTRSTTGGAGSAGHPVAPGSRPRPAANRAGPAARPPPAG
jgi:hypothetical protein